MTVGAVDRRQNLPNAGAQLLMICCDGACVETEQHPGIVPELEAPWERYLTRRAGADLLCCGDHKLP